MCQGFSIHTPLEYPCSFSRVCSPLFVWTVEDELKTFVYTYIRRYRSCKHIQLFPVPFLFCRTFFPIWTTKFYDDAENACAWIITRRYYVCGEDKLVLDTDESEVSFTAELKYEKRELVEKKEENLLLFFFRCRRPLYHSFLLRRPYFLLLPG